MGSLLLWSVLLLSWPLSPRPSLRLRLTLMPTTMVPTVMVPIPPTDTEATDMDTHMPTTERGPLRLSPRLMLMLCMDTTDMPDPTSMVDTVPMVPTPDTTGDKFPAKEDSVQQSSRSSIANIIGQNCISRHSVPIYLV